MSEDSLPDTVTGDANPYRYVKNSAANATDPSGHVSFDEVQNFSAGWADTLTFGLTAAFRQALDYDDVVNKTGGAYNSGVAVGTVHHALLGNWWGVGFGGSSLATDYAQRSLDRLSRGEDADLTREEARWLRLGGTVGQAATGAVGLAKPMGIVWGSGSAGKAGVIGLAGYGISEISAPKEQTALGYLEAFLPLAVGLRTGFTKTAMGRFNAGVAVGRPPTGAALGGAGGVAGRTGLEGWSYANYSAPGLRGLTARVARDAFGYSCFAAGTKLMARGEWGEGYRCIEDITPADEVLSRDEFDAKGPLEWKRVEETFTRFAEVVDLRAGGIVIRTTGEHPFYVVNRADWVAAQDLAIGEALVGHDGAEVIVEGVAPGGEWVAVYNLRVADYHTYFVGDEAWGFSVWAHNASCENPGAIRDAVDTIAGVDAKRAKNIATYAQRLIQKGESDTKVVAYLTAQGVDSAVAARGLEASKHAVRHGGPITPEMRAWAEKHRATLIDPGDPAIKDLRARYMGDTPQKGSDVHRQVVDRMLADGQLRQQGGVIELSYLDPKTQTTKWINIRSKDVHMGHLEDAVTFWNETGRFTGAKSTEVRAFMTDPSKYALQHKSNNIAAGNKIKVREYLPTPISSLPVIQ